MCEKFILQLETASIKNVPLQTFDEFSFIVNGKEYKTSRLISDLLSPVISHIHKSDPTINKFNIVTTKPGDFSNFLKLVNFEENKFPETELVFIAEVLEKLGTQSISIENEELKDQIANDNIFSLLKKHELFKSVYSKQIEIEIDFISSHLFELLETSEEDLLKLDIEILERVINNGNLKIIKEDQLLKFVNQLYSNDRKYSILYDFILFEKVGGNEMKEFLSIYDIGDVTRSVWISLSERLKNEIKTEEDENEEELNRYSKSCVLIEFNPSNPEQGIINYLKNKYSNDIKSQINVKVSTLRDGDPYRVLDYNDNSGHFRTNDHEQDWICFDFGEKRIIPKCYTIKSANKNPNTEHPKS